MYIVNVISVAKDASLNHDDEIRSDVFLFDTFDEALVFSSEVHSNYDSVKNRQFVSATTSEIKKGGNARKYLDSLK